MAITLGLRPRIRFEVAGEATALAGRVRQASADYQVTVAGTYVVVRIPDERQHYWSPQLQVTLEDHHERVLVSGLITPMPAVWTLFAGIYALVLVLGFFGTIYGLAQWQLDQPPYALWSFPATLLLIGSVYAASMVGQRLGNEQTRELTAFLHHCLEQ